MNLDCERGGTLLRCGQMIRLRHVHTKNGTSTAHDHRSPISNMQEVSAFEGSGRWRPLGILECLHDDRSDEGKVTFWMREAPVRLRHQSTGARFLGARSEHLYQHPIPGHIEVAGYPENSISWDGAEHLV